MIRTVLSKIINWTKSFFSIVLCILTLKKPIERDRWLFGRSGVGMIVLAVVIAVILPLMIWGVMEVDQSAEINEILLGNYDTDVSSLSGSIKADSTITIEADQHKVQHNHLWSVLSQYTDPGNLPAAQKGKGYFWALICAIAGIFCLSGFAVSSLVSFITRVSERWKKGLLHYNSFFSDYVVIIGVNEQTATIIKKCLKEPGVKYILIQTRKDVERERAKLELKLEKAEESKIVFYFGERTLYEDISNLKVENAKEVYILGENMEYENELDHDSFNMTCLELIAKYCKTIKGEEFRNNWGGDSIKCHVELEYQSTFTAFKSTHIYKNFNEGRVEFIPFNVHEIWAKKVLVDNYAVYPEGNLRKVQYYLPIDTYRIDGNAGTKETINLTESEEKFVHLVIVGMNQMGVALAVQAAQLVHLPNYVRNPHLRTTITFIDNNAVKEGEYLMGRFSPLFALCRHRTIVCGPYSFNKNSYAVDEMENDIQWSDVKGNVCEWNNKEYHGRFDHLGTNFMDIQWEFIEGNVATKDIEDYISALSEDTKHRTCTIAVCLNNPQQSIATALYLPEIVLKRAHQILVYQKNSFDLIEKIATSEKEWKRYEKLRPFGMVEGCYTEDMFDSYLAKLTHMVYTGKLSKGQPYRGKVKSEADRLWKEIGIDYRLSNINLVDSFKLKLRSAGNTWTEQKETLLDDEKLKTLAMAEHNRWLTERLIMGYRPLISTEWHDIEQKVATDPKYDYLTDKQRLKIKSRAHLDICSNTQFEKRDPETYNQGTDRKIVSVIPYLLNTVQRMLVHDILVKVRNDQSPTSFVWDMKKVDVDDKDRIVIEKSKKGNEDRKESLHDFWVGKNLITRKQWRMVMGELPPQLHDCPQKDDDKPVTFVSKKMIDEFLVVCNHITGLKFRLPWREEWNHVDTYCGEDVKDLEQKVWQWTQSQYQENCYWFCGRSKQFVEKKWGVRKGNRKVYKQSYWLPNFTSSDLGFRLVLPYVFDMEVPDEFDDGAATIDDLLSEKNLVPVKGGVIEFKDDNNVGYKVSVSDYRISRTPITQRQWEAVMGVNSNKSLHRGDDYPVEMVSYDRAIDFIDSLNKKRGGNFKLPTEAEWQMAAELSKAEEKNIWHSGNSKSTHKVTECGSKRAQISDISDMCGNVWEWCGDYYATFEDFLEPDKLNDEGGPNEGFVRVLRGGSWQFDKEWCCITMRSYWLPDYAAEDVGFRIAITENDYSKLKNAKGTNG